MSRHDEDLFDRRARALLGDDDASRGPDVSARVLAALAAADPSPAAIPDRPRSGRWLTAALVLLGLTVVGAILLQGRGGDADDRQDVDEPAGVVEPQDPPPDPDWHEVLSAQDIAALPDGVRFVRGTNLDDDMVGRLAERSSIRQLELRAVRKEGVRAPHSLTAAALPHIARMTDLRRLELSFQPDLSGVDLTPLAALPLLEHLALRYLDTTNDQLAVLPRLPSLRTLDLTLNHGFDGAGVGHIARTPGLEELTLQGCSQLCAADLVPLGSLRRLRSLDLRGMGRSQRGIIVFDPAVVSLEGLSTAASDAAVAHEQAHALPMHRGGLAEGWEDLVEALTDIEELNLAETGLSADAVAGLEPLEHLKRLDVSHNRQLRIDPHALPAGLEELSLAHTPTGDSIVAELTKRASLRSLDLTATEISPSSLQAVRGSPQLEELSLGDFTWLDRPAITTLTKAGFVIHWRGDDETVGAWAELCAARYPLRRDLRMARERRTPPPIKVVATGDFSADGGVDAHDIHLRDGDAIDLHCVLGVSPTRSFLMPERWDDAAAVFEPDSDGERRVLALLQRWADETWTDVEQAEILALPSVPGERGQLDQYDAKRKRLLRSLRLYERVAYPTVAKVFEGDGTIALSLALTPRGGAEQILHWRVFGEDSHARLECNGTPVGIDSDEEAALLLSMKNWLRRQVAADGPQPFQSPPADLDGDARLVWDACRRYLQQTSPRVRGTGTVMDNPGRIGSRFFSLSDAATVETRYRFDHEAGSATRGRLFVDDELVELGSEEEQAALARLDRALRLRRRALGEDFDELPVDRRAAMLHEELEAYRAAFVRDR